MNLRFPGELYCGTTKPNDLTFKVSGKLSRPASSQHQQQGGRYQDQQAGRSSKHHQRGETYQDQDFYLIRSIYVS